MKKSILTIQDLSKSYANEGVQNHVLKHIDLEIYEGDFTVIMGPSGSGKSTLLYCISGMEAVSSGSVLHQGRDITKLKEHQLSNLRLEHFGFIFQQIHLVSNLTLLENVLVPGLSKKGSDNSDVFRRANALLEAFQVNEAAGRLPSQVSGGEQQRAAIARALINEAELVFADEPTGALNQKNSTIVLDMFSKLNESGQSLVMVTHDRRAAIRANRILYILDGRLEGELELSPYKESEAKAREIQVNAWLESLAW